MNRTTCLAATCLLVAGLALAPAQAPAHESRLAHPLHYGYAQPPGVMPRWLRRHHDFRRWYRYNHHRFGRHVSWPRMYRYFVDDRRRLHRHHRKYCLHDFRDMDRYRHHERRRYRRGREH